MTNELPFGVVDSLSAYQVGGPITAAADGATSGLSKSKIQQWLRDIIDNGDGTAVPVNANNALQYPPCYYAVSKVAGHIGMMSWSLKEKIGERQRREANDHQSYHLLRNPNDWYAPSVFTETVTGHAVYRGNGRAYIRRDAFMRPIDLTIMLPDRTQTVIVDGEKWHITSVLIDSEQGLWREYKVHDRDCLHIMGFSPDGFVGYDILHMARQSIGVGLAQQKQQSNHYSRNGMPGMLLKVPPKTFRGDEAQQFLADFRDMHEGIDNVGRTALLQHGIEAQTLSQTGRDSQTVEGRQFQREEMALWWHLESMLGEDGTSYNSEEQRQLAYLKGLPGKMKRRWEEERDRKLLTELDKRRGRYHHQLNPGSLLQADMKTTLETLEIGIRSTIYSSNDARDILGLDARPGGDEYGNPNTSSGGTPPADPPQNVSAETEPTAEKLRGRLVAAYESRLQDLWSVEANRIRNAMAKPDKLSGWVQNFYASAEWPKTFIRVWTEFGGDEAAAKQVMVTHETQIAKAISDEAPLEALLDEWSRQPAALAKVLAGTEDEGADGDE